VLVVDDNKLQRRIHQRMVEQQGYRCDIATTGRQAIEMTQTTSYTLVLMDLMMGGSEDGWSAARKIRRKSKDENFPKIVAVTGLHIDQHLIHSCVAAGMNDIIHKPMPPSVLHKLLSSHSGQAVA
jgi:CheY-like chemotaxis protein